MSDLHTLLRTTLPSSVRAEYGPGNLPRLVVKTRLGEGEVYFQGAHVTAWRPASASGSAAAPVLWMSKGSYFETGKPLRGGVPICFPWFGSHAFDPKAPGHGFARLTDWTLIEAKQAADGAVTLALELASDRPLSPLWPHAFRAVYRITIGSTLTMALEVTNPGKDPFTFEEALHTYFAVKDVREVTVTGLEQTDYLDKVANFERKNQGNDPIRFTGETDRVYLKTTTECVIRDPGEKRRITIRKTGSDVTVVWNPWIAKARAMPDFGDEEWTEMVCVETCNANVHARTLAPGASHTMTAIIEVHEL